jgi:D-3-phosphoglycerate dehydrogenase / 2-oxoglutarate reductase
MGPRKIFVLDELTPAAREVLSPYDSREKEAPDDFLKEAEVLVTWPSRAKKDLLVKMPAIRMVQTLSAGVDSLDLADLPQGVQVFSNAGAFTGPVAEHAWGLLLGVAKGLHVRGVRTVPRRLRGKTLLVLGCGAIGSEVARLSKSLDMRTVGVSRSFPSPDVFDERHPIEELGDVIGAADAVLVALPLTDKTRGILDLGTLSRAKREAMVVNIGRGDLASEEGVLRWLKENPEARYATDVFWFKDGKESFQTELWNLSNFAGTLHISGLPSGEDLSVPKLEAAKNVRRFLETGTAKNRVDLAEYQGKA